MNAPVTPPTNLLGMDRTMLEQFFAGMGEKPFRARQLLQWVHQRYVTEFEQMTDLSRSLREQLSACAVVTRPEAMREQVSNDGTVKWLIREAGGSAVETVYIPEPKRGTLCISSQVGCMLNCTFCSTATQGFKRNLSADEIIGQVWYANHRLAELGYRERPITNVVFMGMGEPMLNLDAVVPALSLLRDQLAYGLAARRVTISTAGVVPAIDQLADGTDFALAVSLHAANDELRERLVPLNRKYPLDELMAACKRFTQARPKRSVTFEYTMIKGVNDQPHHAKALPKRLNGIPCKLNLIPFNPFVGTPFQCSDAETMEAFQAITRAAGIVTTIRKTRGDDIDAACGQLVGRVLAPSERRRLVQSQLARQAIQASPAAS